MSFYMHFTSTARSLSTGSSKPQCVEMVCSTATAVWR